MAKAETLMKPSYHRIVVVFFTLLVLFPLLSPAAAVDVKGKNKSSPGEPKQWATGKDEGELLAEVEARGGRSGGGSVVEDEGDEFAGDFASLDSMLHWAIDMGILISKTFASDPS